MPSDPNVWKHHALQKIHAKGPLWQPAEHINPLTPILKQTPHINILFHASFIPQPASEYHKLASATKAHTASEHRKRFHGAIHFQASWCKRFGETAPLIFLALSRSYVCSLCADTFFRTKAEHENTLISVASPVSTLLSLLDSQMLC